VVIDGVDDLYCDLLTGGGDGERHGRRLCAILVVAEGDRGRLSRTNAGIGDIDF
jgi:hypothetical protein